MIQHLSEMMLCLSSTNRRNSRCYSATRLKLSVDH